MSDKEQVVCWQRALGLIGEGLMGSDITPDKTEASDKEQDSFWESYWRGIGAGDSGNCSEGAKTEASVSDGSTAQYYSFKDIGATELQHLISHKNMNAQLGEIFRTCYRYGEASHSDPLREARKIKFYIEAEIERLLKIKET